MFDGFWSGILGGLFGSAIAQWLRKFRYWTVFLVTALGAPTFIFFLSIYVRGWEGSLEFFSGSSLLVITLSISFGLAATILAFIGSLSASKKNEQEKNK